MKTVFKRAACFATVAAVILCVPLALSARDDSRPAFIVTGKEACFVGEVSVVAPATVMDVSISPNGRFVLVLWIKQQPEPGIFDARKSPLKTKRTLALSLFDAQTGRTRVLKTWESEPRYGWFPDSVSWLPDNDTAVFSLVSVYAPDDESVSTGNTVLMLVHSDRAELQTVPVLSGQDVKEAYVQAFPSPTRPEMLVHQEVGDKQQFRLLSANGVWGKPVDIVSDFLAVYGWSKDGNSVLLNSYRPSTNTAPPERIAWLWNRDSLALTALPKRPNSGNFVRNQKYIPPPAPLRLTTERGNMETESGAKSTATCVVATGADGKERVVIAANAEAVSVVGKPASPVLLYKQNDALYAVPIRSLNEAAFTEYLRSEAERSASKIQLSIAQYFQDYDEELPLPTHNVPKDLKPYLEREESLRDPRTGVNAFTYTYTGKPDASGRKPLFTYKTTTGTICGYLTSDGNFATEPELKTEKPQP